MDGFKKLPKMKCGGNVEKEVKKCGGGSMKKGGKYKEGGDVDLKQDKALIKKAFKQHDKQEHKGKHTNLKGLKKGGPTTMDRKSQGRNMSRALNQKSAGRGR